MRLLRLLPSLALVSCTLAGRFPPVSSTSDDAKPTSLANLSWPMAANHTWPTTPPSRKRGAPFWMPKHVAQLLEKWEVAKGAGEETPRFKAPLCVRREKPLFHEWLIVVPNDLPYNDKDKCGKGFLDNFRRCRHISAWGCDYLTGYGPPQTPILMAFGTDKFCTKWQISEAIRDASYGDIEVPCETVKYDSEVIAMIGDTVIDVDTLSFDDVEALLGGGFEFE